MALPGCLPASEVMQVRNLVMCLLVLPVGFGLAQPTTPDQRPWETWTPPTVALPVPNGYDTYLTAFDLKRQIDRVNHLPSPSEARPVPPWAPGPPPVLDPWGEGPPDKSLRQRVALYADVLGLVREALSQPCRVPPPESLGDDLLPFYSGFQAVARLLAMESAASRDEGRFGAAANSGSDCLEMAQDVATRRTLLAFPAGESIEETGGAAVDAALPHLSAAECKALLARLARVEAKRVSLNEVADGEDRMWRIWFKDAVRILGVARSPAVLPPLPGLTATDQDHMTWQEAWQAMGAYFTALRRRADDPSYSARKPPTARDALVPPEPSGHDLNRVFFKDAQARAMSRLRIATVAARAYALEQHRLPVGLADLAHL